MGDELRAAYGLPPVFSETRPPGTPRARVPLSPQGGGGCRPDTAPDLDRNDQIDPELAQLLAWEERNTMSAKGFGFTGPRPMTEQRQTAWEATPAGMIEGAAFSLYAMAGRVRVRLAELGQEILP